MSCNRHTSPSALRIRFLTHDESYHWHEHRSRGSQRREDPIRDEDGDLRSIGSVCVADDVNQSFTHLPLHKVPV